MSLNSIKIKVPSELLKNCPKSKFDKNFDFTDVLRYIFFVKLVSQQ